MRISSEGDRWRGYPAAIVLMSAERSSDHATAVVLEVSDVLASRLPTVQFDSDAVCEVTCRNADYIQLADANASTVRAGGTTQPGLLKLQLSLACVDIDVEVSISILVILCERG
jgi:hypothetical protein